MGEGKDEEKKERNKKEQLRLRSGNPPLGFGAVE